MVKRYAGPGVAFLVGTGFQIGGWVNEYIGAALLAGAAVWLALVLPWRSIGGAVLRVRLLRLQWEHEPPVREADESICSDGIRWVYVQRNYLSGITMRPECCEHRVELRLRSRDGSTAPLGTRDRVGILGDVPYCAAGHEVPYSRSASYEQASSTAHLLLEARLRGG